MSRRYTAGAAIAEVNRPGMFSFLLPFAAAVDYVEIIVVWRHYTARRR